MASTANVNKGFEDIRKDAREVADKAKDAAAGAVDKAKDVAGAATDRAKEMASHAADTARDWASNAGRKAEDAVGTVGQRMAALADTVREQAPREGMLGHAAGSVADALEHGGRYLQKEGLGGMADDVTAMIRRNPLPAVLVGVGLGFLLARTMSSRS